MFLLVCCDSAATALWKVGSSFPALLPFAVTAVVPWLIGKWFLHPSPAPSPFLAGLLRTLLFVPALRWPRVRTAAWPMSRHSQSSCVICQPVPGLCSNVLFLISGNLAFSYLAMSCWEMEVWLDLCSKELVGPQASRRVELAGRKSQTLQLWVARAFWLCLHLAVTQKKSQSWIASHKSLHILRFDKTSRLPSLILRFYDVTKHRWMPDAVSFL